MACAVGAAPLRLKDLLELDCDSCSAAGFRCYPRRLGEPTMLRLLESSAEAALRIGRSPSLRGRCPSKLSSLSRSLSRRLWSGGIWRRRDADPAAAVSDSEPETTSLEPIGSSGSSSGRVSRSELNSDELNVSSASSASGSMKHAAGEDHEAMKRRGSSSSGSEVDDKEQLSPVGVMDFPFDAEDEDDRDAGACSPYFDGRLARLHTGMKVRRIRRLGSLNEVAPVDLEARLAATSGHDDRADDVQAEKQLQCRADPATPPCPSKGHHFADVDDEHDDHGLVTMLLMDTVSAGADVVRARLLLDFVLEMKHSESEHTDEPAPTGHLLLRKAQQVGDGEILAVARGWLLDGTETQPRWGLKEVLRGGEAILAEMERGRQWMQVSEEEREVGAVVAALLVDQLVDEVMSDMVV